MHIQKLGIVNKWPNSLPVSLTSLHDQFIFIMFHVVEQNLLESEEKQHKKPLARLIRAVSSENPPPPCHPSLQTFVIDSHAENLGKGSENEA